MFNPGQEVTVIRNVAFPDAPEEKNWIGCKGTCIQHVKRTVLVEFSEEQLPEHVHKIRKTDTYKNRGDDNQFYFYEEEVSAMEV